MNSFLSSKYTPEALFKLTTSRERKHFGLSDEDLTALIASIIGDSFVNQTYSFILKQEGELILNGYSSGSIESLCQDLILRRMYHDLCDRLHVGQSNRNKIIRQMSILMNTKKPFYAIRLDIRSFYESINRKVLFEKIKNTCKVNPLTIRLLECLFENPIINSITGLPRGLSVSSAMAEYDLKYFDYDVQKMDGVYYYARFVDDGIIFCSSKDSQTKVYRQVPKMLNKLDLKINTEKTYQIDSVLLASDTPLEYLGYSFWRENEKLHIGIAERKLGKIKTRITKSFINLAKKRNFDLLKNRMRFLTGNCRLSRNASCFPMMSGVYYNYRLLSGDGFKCLNDLDVYYQRVLHCTKGKLGRIITSSLIPSQISELEKISFRFGFDKKIKVSFSPSEINALAGCWK